MISNSVSLLTTIWSTYTQRYATFECRFLLNQSRFWKSRYLNPFSYFQEKPYLLMFFVEFGAVLHHHRFSIVLTSSSGSASHLGMVLARTALLHSLSLWTAFCGLQLQQFQEGATVSWASLWSYEIQPVTFFFITSWSIALDLLQTLTSVYQVRVYHSSLGRSFRL